MAEKIYGSLYISQRIPGGNEVSVNPAKDESSLVDAHQRDKADRDSMPGSAYRYSSYSVFKNRAFSSDTINIDKKGFRIHPLPEQTDSGEIFRIWVFGASPVFGATNTDLWTIPARLQFHMSEQFYGRPVIVRNMAVAGYTSWQTLLTLQKAIGETKTPPNAVVVFTLRNDLSTAYHQPEPGCRHLMYTGVGSHSALERSWENLSRGNYIFLQDILNNFKAKFTGISEISRLIWKATSVVESNFNPELMIKRYRKEKKKYNSLVAECMPIALNHFRNNISLMADLAKRHNALFFAGSLPELAVTKKQLAGNEVVENYLTENYFFALTEDELNNLDQLPRSRYKQRYLADKQTYLDNVNRFEISLRGISNSANANYIHLGEFSDQLGDDIQLFATSIHFTNEGADLLAQEITRQVALKLPPVNLIKERGN